MYRTHKRKVLGSFAPIERKHFGRSNNPGRRRIFLGKIPNAMTVFAKTFMFNNSKDDAKVEEQCWDKELARHLWVVYFQ